MTLHAKLAMPDLQRYPIKVLFDQVCIIVNHVFVFLNYLFHFAVSLKKLISHFLLIENNGEIHRIKHFSNKKKTKLSSTFMIRWRFQGLPLYTRALLSLHGALHCYTVLLNLSFNYMYLLWKGLWYKIAGKFNNYMYSKNRKTLEEEDDC